MKKKKIENIPKRSDNVSDKVLSVISDLNNNYFVQEIILTKNKDPVILQAQFEAVQFEGSCLSNSLNLTLHGFSGLL